jgi:hypothetical protein
MEGTFAHALMETCLKNGFDPEDMVGRTIEAKGQRTEVEPEWAEPVGVMVDFVRKLFIGQNADVLIEHPLSGASIDPDVGGTTDVNVYQHATRTLHVVDYKHGAGVAIEIETWMQGKGYGLLSYLQSQKQIDEIQLHVVQPRCEHPKGPVRSLTLDPMDLLSFGLELREAAERTRQPDAPLVPGDWCQFCAARGVCPKLYEEGPVAAEQFELEDAILASQGETLSRDELGKRLDVIDKLKLWMTGIQRHAWFEAQRGFVPIKGKRQWADGELAMRQAVRQFKLSEDDLFTRRPVSPRKFEVAVGGAAAATDFLKAHLAPKKRAVALAHESDPREAVAPGVLDDLKDILND